MKFSINPEDAPVEVVAKVKRLIQKDIKDKVITKRHHVELRFNKRLDSVKVIDVQEFDIVARYDLNYKDDETIDVTPNPETTE